MALNYAKLFNRRFTPTVPPDPALGPGGNSAGGYGGQWGGGESGIARVSLSPRMRLDSVIEKDGHETVPLGH
jgi:hypothetical protein